MLDFTDSYATGVQVVIVTEGLRRDSMDDLGNEKMIGTQARHHRLYIYASDTPENGGYGEDHVSGYDSGATAVQALVNGQVDAVIIDEAPAKEFVAANEGLTILDTRQLGGARSTAPLWTRATPSPAERHQHRSERADGGRHRAGDSGQVHHRRISAAFARRIRKGRPQRRSFWQL